MEKKKMIIPKALVLSILAVLGAIGVFLGSYQAGILTPVDLSLGAAAGSKTPGESWNINGNTTIAKGVGLGGGTSTALVMNPTGATSTISSIVCEFTVASSTTGQLKLYKGHSATGASSTDGYLFGFSLAGGEPGIFRWTATTSENGDIQQGLGPIDLTFGPTSTPVIIEQEGLFQSGGNFFGKGQCSVEWKSVSALFN